MSSLGRGFWLQAVFGWLNFVVAVPSLYLLMGLPLVMREHGWSGTDIGLFQLAGLPALFKFALAWPVQRWRVAAGQFQGWAMLLCLALAVLLWLTGQQALLDNPLQLFALALLAGVLATWADIPVNALAIKLLPPEQQMRAGSVRAAALFLGAIVGAGVMLLVQSRWGWQAPFLVMGAGLLLAVVALACVQEGKAHALPPVAPLSEGQGGPGFFRQPGAWLWTSLLLGGFPFIGAAWLYLKPLLLDQGMAVNQVAAIAGIGGGVVGALASLLCGRWWPRLGVDRAIALSLGAALLALCGLTLAVWLQTGALGLLLAALLLAVAMGAMSALVFGLMMGFTRQHRQASDYGLQASLFVASRLLVPIGAGVLLDHFGHLGMLLGLSLAMLAVCLLVLGLSGRLGALARA